MGLRLRLLVPGLLVLLPAPGLAQSFNSELLRYRAAQQECRDAHDRRITPICDQRCRAAAERRRDQCLAAAEDRYRTVLRRQLRSRR